MLKKLQREILTRKKKMLIEKFEYEMKGKFLQESHFLLVQNHLEEFEQKLSLHFLLYFGKLLPLQFSYLDWLVTQLRPIRKQKVPSDFFNTDYIQSEIAIDSRTFLSLIQFLNYAQDLDFEHNLKIEYLGEIPYRQVIFKLRDFLKFQNPNIKDTNNYQLGKIKKFFKKLQTEGFVTSFSDNHFRSLVLIPQVKLDKCPKQKFWIGRVWLVEELFYYNYPFFLPKFFQVFSSVNIEKEFFVQEFLNSCTSIISNQRITNIKRAFIQLIKLYQQYDLVENNFKIISNESFIDTDKLTIFNISEGFVIYEKLKIKNLSFMYL